MPSNCIFCKIISKEAPGDICYEDDTLIIFKDIKPSATFHLLSCPKEHIGNVNSLGVNHSQLLKALVTTGKQVLEENGGNLSDVLMGFHKPPFNSVGHLHLHVISPASQMSFLSRLIFKPNTWWFSSVDEILEKLESGNSKL